MFPVNGPDLLIASRAVKGVGGAMPMPGALSLLTIVFTERRKAMTGHGATAVLGPIS